MNYYGPHEQPCNKNLVLDHNERVKMSGKPQERRVPLSSNKSNPMFGRCMFEEMDRAPLRSKLLLEKILMTFLDTLAPTHSLKLCIYIAIIQSSSKKIFFFFLLVTYICSMKFSDFSYVPFSQ